MRLTPNDPLAMFSNLTCRGRGLGFPLMGITVLAVTAAPVKASAQAIELISATAQTGFHTYPASPPNAHRRWCERVAIRKG